jgi:SAM-dependent methyltransferase
MRIDFDTELERGLESYEDVLGRWWLRQSENAAHRRAYSRIARYVHDSFHRPLRLIVDYGCGTGALLSRLAWRYPRARLVGLDGSAFMLEQARRRIRRLGPGVIDRIRLQRIELPGFGPQRELADLVVFAFPNIVPAQPEGFRPHAHRLTADERYIVRALAHASDAPGGHGDGLRDRLIALNLRNLLKPGGYCVRVEYCGARRDELSRRDLARAGMEEGSLDLTIEGRRPRQWFRLVASTWFRSGVMEDVAHQHGSNRTGPGGYVITVLRAV